jgi:hypothetical protein
VSRQHLARLMFEDLEDPLASLHWNLAELRRALGPDSVRGEAIGLDRGSLGPIDLDVLSRGNSLEGVSQPGIGCELLEGMSFSGSPAFDRRLRPVAS